MTNYAFLIGCNYYGRNKLNGCINDILLMKTLLKDKYRIISMTDEKTSIFFFNKINNLESLVNKTFYPTYNNIISILNILKNNLKNDDKLLFHFSGHGIQLKTTDKTEKDKKDEAIVIYKSSKTLTFYTDNELFVNFNQIKCPIFCIFDCCHSASIIDVEKQYYLQDTNTKLQSKDKLKKFISKKNISTSDNVNTKIIINKNIRCISGCFDKVYSYDKFIPSENKHYGSLTYSISKCYNKEYKTINEFVDAITNEVYKINNNKNQTPVYSYTDDNNLYFFM